MPFYAVYILEAHPSDVWQMQSNVRDKVVFVHWTYARRVASRLGKRGVGPWGIIQLADGGFFVGCAEEDQWARLVDYIGKPEWASSEIIRGMSGTAPR